MNTYIEENKEYILVSKNTPLLSNLSMCENISLIKCVHHLISIDLAKKEAIDRLTMIKREYIAEKRVVECNSIDIFYTMCIRAMMMDNLRIIIVTPSDIVENKEEMDEIIDIIQLLNNDKKILIVDIDKNKLLYKGHL